MPINIDELLSRVDLAEVAERAGAKLKPTGKGYRGNCPLHEGKNPTSFAILKNPDRRDRWFCFSGCTPASGHKWANGDAVEFVKRWKGLGFLDAVRELASIAGVPLEDLGITAEEARRIEEARQQRERQRGILEMAADYYRDLLQDEPGAEARAYAEARGWNGETVKELGLGYADGHLLDHLRSLDADGSTELAEVLDLAREAGLIFESDDGRLRDAIPDGYLVYVHRRAGAVEYLTGRSVTSDDPRYKSRNLHSPKKPYWLIHNYNRPIVVVEGQADAITAWQWGDNAVALCGGDLDDEKAAAMRHFKAVYLVLDSDEAGRGNIPGIVDQLGPLTMVAPPLPEKPAKDEGEGRERYKDLNEWLVDGQAAAENLAELLEGAMAGIDLAIREAVAAPAYEHDDHLERLARLTSALPYSMRGKHVRQICNRHELTTTRDFRRLIAEHGVDGGSVESNGFEILDGRLVCYGEPLFGGIIRITHELVQDDGANPPKVLYTVQGELDDGQPLEAIEVRADEFDTMKWIPRHWGARAIVMVSPSRTWQLRRAIQEISRHELSRERVYTYAGWTKVDERRVYLTTSGALGAEGLDPDVRVDLGQNNMRYYELPAPPPDPRPAMQASLEFLDLADYQVTVPLWVAMYAAPLQPLKSLNAVLWVYGSTQSGKSTVSHVALSHFGAQFTYDQDYRAPKDWTSTVTDLEGAMFRAKDIPIIVDDYAPAHTSPAEARDMARKAHYTVRSVGNRSSRGRARADLSEQVQRPPRGLVIVTAENPLVGQSIVGRMIYLPVEKGQVIGDDTSALDRAQHHAQAGIYAQAMAGYIAWLAGEWERLEEELPARFQAEIKHARNIFPSDQSRLTDYYALLVIADHLALEYASEVGALDDYDGDVEALAEIHRQMLIEVLKSQRERVSGQSPVLKFFQAISDMLSKEEVYLAPKGTTESFVPPPRAELIGWEGTYNPNRRKKDKEEPYRIFLLTNVALAKVKAYWQDLDERFDALADAVRREMWQQDLIERRPDTTHYEETVWINSKVGTKRVLIVDPMKVWEKFEIALLNDIITDRIEAEVDEEEDRIHF